MSDVDDDDIDDLEEGVDVYRSPRTPAQKRARRQAITLLLVVAFLVVSLLFAAAYWGGWFTTPKAKATTNPTSCPTVTAPHNVAPSQVKVNVYNASTRNGLAKKVSDLIKAQGYVIGTVANDPLKRDVKTPAEVRYGKKGKLGAELVASEVQGAKLVEDKRKDATVDLVLGPNYVQLTPLPTAGSTGHCDPTSTATT